MIVKPIVVLCCLAVAVLAKPSEKYTEKYDNVNLKEILESDRLLEGYFHCLMDEGPCTSEGKELKSHMQDALETGCKKCTKAQEYGVYTVIDFLLTKKRDMWKKLCEKYDPEGVWRKQYEERAKEKGLVIPEDYHLCFVESRLRKSSTMIVKPIVVLCCLAVAVLAKPSEKYTEKYDNVNLKEILESDRLLEGYFHCLMDEGPCTSEGKELKSHMQDALETGCKKCTKAQEDGVYTVIDFLLTKKRDMWKKLCEKYDPEGVWRKQYEERAKEKGLVIPED
ncbi:uncharacterized protein LOC123661848 [Melitaea cinxia]|uniref:uncharacterized protein LOC123661848 n=1 Tax=Melitaea cinxia TaxID=113334 RepID=UPI001E26ED9B|nr:uncharacterized protein LOC123661848 [Melitaea cinxia]